MELKSRSQDGAEDIQSCLDFAARFDDGELLEAPNGDLLTDVSEEEGWGVCGYTDNFGPHALYAHCWAIPGDTEIVLFRAEAGTPQDFNKRSHIIQDLVDSFTRPGE